MERKVYQTKFKTLILDCFKNNGNKTMTAIEIKDYLNLQGTLINLATVYRNLKKLVDEKKLLKLNINGSPTYCYQIVKDSCNSSEHLHLRCNQCGKIIHLDCDFMEIFKNHVLKEHDFTIKCKDSVIYGICLDCQKKNKKL